LGAHVPNFFFESWANLTGRGYFCDENCPKYLIRFIVSLKSFPMAAAKFSDDDRYCGAKGELLLSTEANYQL